MLAVTLTGGAGTIFVRGGSTYGDLTVDNGTVTGNKRTILPSLGKGVAGSGSGGATLSTGRSKVIPAYFVGHWVEVRNGAGVLEGTWRISRKDWMGVWSDPESHLRMTAGVRQSLGANSLIQVDFGSPALYGPDYGALDTLNVVTVFIKTYI